MAKTLFNVLLPATGKRYDLWVPDDMPMQQASSLVAEALQVAEPAYYSATPDATLMHVATGEIPKAQSTVAELGFTDGTRFVLL